MALLDFIPGGDWNFLILVVVIVLIVFIWPHIVKKKAEVREIKKSGPTARNILVELEKEKTRERHLEASEEALEENLPKGEAGTVAKKVEDTAEAVEEMEQAATEAQEVGLALVADLRNTTEEIKTNTESKIAIETAGERIIANLSTFEKKINFLNKHDDIDGAAKTHLGKELEGVAAHLNQQAKFEKQAIEHQQKFCDHLRQSIDDLKPIAADARSKIKKLNNKEKREKKSFNKEVKAIIKAIKGKRKQLKKEKTKGADPALIAQLQKEIAMLDANKKQLDFFQEQVNKTNELIDLELNKLKGIMQKVRKIARVQAKENKKIRKREKKLKNKSDKLKRKREEVQKSIEKFSQEGSSHGMALAFSRHINAYFEFYLQELKDDLEFEQLVKIFATDNLIALETMESFEKLLGSIINSEKALEVAVETSLKIISMIMTAEIQGSLRNEAAALQAHLSGLNKESEIDKKIVALEQYEIKESMLEIKLLNDLIKKYKDVIAENEALHKEESQHLGNAMGAMMNRKVAIDEKYMGQAKRFGEQLQKRNQKAAAAYQQKLSS